MVSLSVSLFFISSFRYLTYIFYRNRLQRIFERENLPRFALACMARTKQRCLRVGPTAPSEPSNVHCIPDDNTPQTATMGDKRPAQDDLAGASKLARTTQMPPSGGAGGSATSPQQKLLPTTSCVMEHQYFIQIYKPGQPWILNKNPWVELTPPCQNVKFTDKSGMNIIISPDTPFFKVLPYGPTECSIHNRDGCGVFVLPVGHAMDWKFDYLLNYFCEGLLVQLIVVKVRCSDLHDDHSDVSWGVEKIVRRKFKSAGSQNTIEPCWLQYSVAQAWRESYKTEAQNLKTALDKLRQDFLGLQHTHAEQTWQLQLRNEALAEIKSATTCPICLGLFDHDEYSFSSGCGHMICQKCHAKKPDKCIICRDHVQKWTKFFGMNAITYALVKLQAQQ